MITWNTQNIKQADDSLMLLGFKGKFISHSLIVVGIAFFFAFVGSMFLSPVYTVSFSFFLVLSFLLYMTDKYKKYGKHGLIKQGRIMKLPKGLRNSIKIINIINK